MKPITILNKDNVPTGPFTRAQVAEKLQSGEFSLDSLAFIEGLSQWTPLRDVLATVDAASAPSPVPAPSAAAPAYSYATTMQPPGHLVYAGFWLRVVAIFVDGLILSPLTIAYFMLEMELKGASDIHAKIVIAFLLLGVALVAFVVRWLYFAMMESSSWQATVGKRTLGLKVTGIDGERIGFGRATGRYFGKILSTFTLMIGFIMAGFTERKQALHDMIAGTLVIRK